MYASDFYQNLCKLNPRLRIYCGNDATKPAGLYIIAGDGEYVHICGVDKNETPKYTIHDKVGHILKSGWFRVLKILLQRQLIDKRKTQRIFNVHFNEEDSRPLSNMMEDPIMQNIIEAEMRGYKEDELIDIGRMIRKKVGNL